MCVNEEDAQFCHDVLDYVLNHYIKNVKTAKA
jgi:hypothetical protein